MGRPHRLGILEGLGFSEILLSSQVVRMDKLLPLYAVTSGIAVLKVTFLPGWDTCWNAPGIAPLVSVQLCNTHALSTADQGCRPQLLIFTGRGQVAPSPAVSHVSMSLATPRPQEGRAGAAPKAK